MRRLPFALFALLPLASLRADNTASPDPKSDAEAAVRMWERFNTAAVVANVDGEAITAENVRQELRPILPRLRQEAKSQEDYRRLLNEQSSKIIDALVDDELVLREFKDKGMQMPSSYVNEQIEEKVIREFNGDRAEYLRSLRRIGRTPLDDRRDMERRIIVEYLNGQQRRSVAELSPAKIQHFYEMNRVEFMQKEAAKISQIALWPGAADSDEDVRRQAEAILARLDKGESFSELAKLYSKDDYRERGGDTGWREIADLNPDIAKSIKGLPDGGHTAPLEFKAGGRLSLYILRRDGFRPEGPLPVGEVREIIEGKVLADAMRTVRTEWLARLREKFFVRQFD